MKKESQSKQSSQTNTEKEKQCPFDKTLKCENCRLYDSDSKRCIFRSILWNLAGIDMKTR